MKPHGKTCAAVPGGGIPPGRTHGTTTVAPQQPSRWVRTHDDCGDRSTSKDSDQSRGTAVCTNIFLKVNPQPKEVRDATHRQQSKDSQAAKAHRGDAPPTAGETGQAKELIGGQLKSQ